MLITLRVRGVRPGILRVCMERRTYIIQSLYSTTRASDPGAPQGYTFLNRILFRLVARATLGKQIQSLAAKTSMSNLTSCARPTSVYRIRPRHLWLSDLTTDKQRLPREAFP